MAPPYKPHIAQTISELMDILGLLMLSSPTFIDESGYFPGMNLDTVFEGVNESLRALRGKLGDDRYIKLRTLSDRMKAHFEADPENKTDDTLKGRALIHEMEDLLMQKPRKG